MDYEGLFASDSGEQGQEEGPGVISPGPSSFCVSTGCPLYPSAVSLRLPGGCP
jgi:hypothetical protein